MNSYPPLNYAHLSISLSILFHSFSKVKRFAEYEKQVEIFVTPTCFWKVICRKREETPYEAYTI
jgi:hypothetical protein